MKSIKLNFMKHTKYKSLSATSLSVTITGRVKILKIKYIKEKPVYYNIIAHLTVGISGPPSPRFNKDFSKVKVYVTAKEFMLLELQLYIS